MPQARYLLNRSLSRLWSDTPPQIRFVEMIIDQLAARGVMDAAAIYEAPFRDLHAGGPDVLFSGHENVIEGIFETLREFNVGVNASAG